MKRDRVQQFIAQTCSSLDSGAKALVREVLRRCPDGVDVESIRDVFPVYAGAIYVLPTGGSVMILDWNLMNAPFESRGRLREANRKVAVGLIALNLAHHALKHTPDRIHSPQAYDEARKLAVQWGFAREVKLMEKQLL